jgi:uncharacterized repeat protein (TIGR01451 family)
MRARLSRACAIGMAVAASFMGLSTLLPATASAASAAPGAPAVAPATAAVGADSGPVSGPKVAGHAGFALKGSTAARNATPAQVPAPNPGSDMTSHGGNVMLTPVIYNVYWLPAGQHYESAATAASDTNYENLLNRWAGDVGGNDFYNIVTQYVGANGRPNNSVSLGGSYTDTTAYPHAGTQADPLSDGDIHGAVDRAVTHFSSPRDLNHIYMVYTALGIEECFSATSCTFEHNPGDGAFCAYHTVFGGPSIYAFMGAAGVSRGCGGATTPNGDAAADNEASVASHELIEAVTDPQLDAWFFNDLSGEIGDLCNQQFGPRNSIGANLFLGAAPNPYALQTEWSNAVHGCAPDLNGARTSLVAPVLTLVKTAPATAVTGQQINYSMTVTNPSNTDASTLTVVTDTLPAGVTFVAGSASPAPSSTSPLTWNLGTLGVHDTKTITFRATSNPQSVNNCGAVNFKDELQIAAQAQVTGCAATIIAKANTTTAVMSSVNPSVFGQPVTFTATVAVAAPGAGTASGTVNFFDGATPLGTGTLSGGTTLLTTSTLAVGSHPITAAYGGDTNFNSSTSAILNQVVNKAATSTVVTSSANPSVFGQPVTFTGTVTANPPGAGTPTGTVQFFDGATPLGTGTLSGGTTTIAAPASVISSVGTHHITATYSGDGSFLVSTSVVFNQVVNKAPTTTSLTAAPPGSVGFGHPVTFTATVSVPPPGAGSPTGPVVFTVDGTPVGSVNLNASEQASITTASLSPGSHSIGAAYQGDGNFLGSSTTLTYLVTCTVTITGNHPGGVIASGDSTCIVNATVGGSVVVPKGTSLAVENSTINGSITASNSPNAIRICGATVVGGAVNVIGAQGLVIVGDPGDANCAVNNISGALQLRNNLHGVEAIGNTVGSLIVSNNSGPGPFPGDGTTISGNIIRHP